MKTKHTRPIKTQNKTGNNNIMKNKLENNKDTSPKPNLQTDILRNDSDEDEIVIITEIKSPAKENASRLTQRSESTTMNLSNDAEEAAMEEKKNSEITLNSTPNSENKYKSPQKLEISTKNPQSQPQISESSRKLPQRTTNQSNNSAKSELETSPYKKIMLKSPKKSPQKTSDIDIQRAQWLQSRNRGSPRKYHQSLKQTSVLMNSSRSYPIMASPKKKQSSGSTISTSPGKSPQKDSAQKALFRQIPGTYLENLKIVIDTVMSEPQDVSLLGDEDGNVVDKFRTLSLPAQKLYVRLLQRKLDLKRISKVVYEDVCDQEDMIEVVRELVETGFCLKEEDLGGLAEFLEVLSVSEVQVLCKDMKVSSKGKKEDMVTALLKFSINQPSIQNIFAKFKKTPSKPSPTPLFKKAKEMAGPCLKLDPEVHRVFMRVLMLYGLPSYDDMEEGGPQATLTALLLINLGKMKFPAYTTNRTRPIFMEREDLLRFEKCCQINTELQKCVQDKKWEAALKHCEEAKEIYNELSKDEKLRCHDLSLPRFLRRFSTLSLLVYMLSASVEIRQKMRQYQEAVDQLRELLDQSVYLQDHRGLWYTRLALNLHSHLKKPAKALDVIEEGLRDPELQLAHRLTLSTRARRLARTDTLAQQAAALPLVEPVVLPKVVIQGRSLHGDIPGYKRAFIRQDSDRHAGEGAVTLCSVEELVIGHYQAMGYPEGLHMEGTTVKSLFGLLLWDQLYTSVPDAFRSPNQASPLDLLDEHFYTARKELIDKRLSEMRGWNEEKVDAVIETVWKEHYEEQCLVSWNIFTSPTHVQGLVKSLGLDVLAAICERLAKNYRHTRSGFPDLIVWNPNTKKSRIVEVKGPNDSLSVKQEVWLDFLVSCGAVAEVCHVEAIGAKKMMKTSPQKTSPKKVSPKKTAKRSTKRDDDDDDDDEDYVYRQTKRRKSNEDCDDDISLDNENGSHREQRNNCKRNTRTNNGVNRNIMESEGSDEDFVCPIPKIAKKNEDNEGDDSTQRKTVKKKPSRGRRGKK